MTVLRIVAGLAFVVIVSLAGTAGIDWWQDRGLIPDLPAPPPAYTPRLPASETLQPSRPEVLRALRARQYDGLSRLADGLQLQAMRDVAIEGRLSTTFGAFSLTDPALAPRFDEWVAADANSFVPYVARARYRFAVAMNRRGTGLARNTSSAQFAAMEATMTGVLADAQDALLRNRFAAEAYAILIDVARTHGDQAACGAIAARGLVREPASLRIRVALAVCRLPRWGGSQNQVIAVANEASSHMAEHPALTALSGFWEWELGRQAGTRPEALDRYTAALQRGEHWFFYRDRAIQNLRMKRYNDALRDVERGLTLEPGEPELLLTRLRVSLNQGRYKEAAADADVIGEFDSGDAWTHYWRGRAYMQAGDNSRALQEFEQAIARDPADLESYRNIDYLLASAGRWTDVIRHWNSYLTLKPDDPEALFERSGTHFQMGNHADARRDALRACELGKAEACGVLSRVPPS